MSPDELTVEKAVAFLEEKEKGPTILGTDPETEKYISSKRTLWILCTDRRSSRGTQKVRQRYQEDQSKRASLHRGMLPQDVDLGLALKLLSLLYTIGKSQWKWK